MKITANSSKQNKQNSYKAERILTQVPDVSGIWFRYPSALIIEMIH